MWIVPSMFNALRDFPPHYYFFVMDLAINIICVASGRSHCRNFTEMRVNNEYYG